jgi:hypothetical protein
VQAAAIGELLLGQAGGVPFAAEIGGELSSDVTRTSSMS